MHLLDLIFIRITQDYAAFYAGSAELFLWELEARKFTHSKVKILF